MKLPKELKEKEKQKLKTKKSRSKKRKKSYPSRTISKEYASIPKKKFTESFAPYLIIIGVVLVIIIVFMVTSLDNRMGMGDNPYKTDITFNTIDGGTIELADHQGQTVLLFFFDLDCPPCGPEANVISDIDDYYPNSQVYILLITVHSYDSNNGLNQFADDHNLDRPIVRDDILNTYSSSFNIAYTPTTILLDKDGSEVERFVGYDPNHYNQIKDEIDTL